MDILPAQPVNNNVTRIIESARHPDCSESDSE